MAPLLAQAHHDLLAGHGDVELLRVEEGDSEPHLALLGGAANLGLVEDRVVVVERGAAQGPAITICRAGRERANAQRWARLASLRRELLAEGRIYLLWRTGHQQLIRGEAVEPEGRERLAQWR